MPLLKTILAGDSPLLFVLLGLFQGGLEARSLLRPTPASFFHRVEADVVVGEMSEPLDVGIRWELEGVLIVLVLPVRRRDARVNDFLEVPAGVRSRRNHVRARR